MGMIIAKKKAPVNVTVPEHCSPKIQRTNQTQKKIPEKPPKESTSKARDCEPLDKWLNENLCRNDMIKGNPRKREVGTWIEIRLFISSTFIDTHSERDILIQRVIPCINRKLAPMYIRVVPVDLRWGVLSSETNTCKDLQKVCLNQIDKCRDDLMCTPWFLCLRTDRYGWVQDNYMPSLGFEQPELFQWINELDKYGKKLSITSLECVHAVQAMKTRAEAPTVFFYKREIIPSSEGAPKYPEQFRWIFDFEYVEKEINDPVLKYQYSVHPKAAEYHKDKEQLENYIKSLPHVKWFDYQAQFKDAKITCKRENARSFGVGYVTGLDTFQNQVEEDLMQAILANYESVDTLQNDNLDLESIQHENAIKHKAATFVGRKALVKVAFDHCRLSEGSNTMILHGEPGCGKSGLLAAVAKKSIYTLRDSGHFVFIHAVDTCPGSTSLKGMLRRLRACLRRFCIDLGAEKFSEYKLSGFKLKEEHHRVLVERAKQYPEKLFVIIVDAVNQFHSALDAWNMWWLPQEDSPKNLKFMISTLNEENGTFVNACNVSPEAKCIPIDEMCKEDLKGIVKMRLSRFNKRLTDNEDPLLGNQMKRLLSKSNSPLYLIAACEALRKFGIFERVTQYIESLPGTISDLFNFLLDEWSNDCGEIFVKDVSALLCLSRDGLTENQINDMLDYKERKENIGDSELLYNANFSRIYDSIAPFLSAGGGGYLRFFHDQLKYAIRRKYMQNDGAFEVMTHKMMGDFFGDIIVKQCCECPSEQPPTYFEHVLNQLVYHQLAAHSEERSMDYLKISLRNINFVKYRIVAKQQQSLSDEYVQALEKATNAEDFKSIKEWQSFVQIYTPYIRAFPKFSYNMAITQASSSYVTKDTALLEKQTIVHSCYPLYWYNAPKESDPMVVKYLYEGRKDSHSADTKGTIVAIANEADNVLLRNLTSGELIYKIKVKNSSTVCLTDEGKHLFVASFDTLGYTSRRLNISLWDVATGTMESSAEAFENGDKKLQKKVSWMQCTDKYLLVGTNFSWIAIADLRTCKTVRSWSTEKEGNDYCYHKVLQMIFSGHANGIIIGWDLEGNQLCSTSGAGKHVLSLASHPTQNKIISGSDDLKIREWSASKTSLELFNEVLDRITLVRRGTSRGNYAVSYDHEGGRILSAEIRDKTLKVYSLDGELLDELRGHKDAIYKISLVKGTNRVITTGAKNECILWDLPDTSTVPKSKTKEMVQEKVRWCAFSVDGSEFVAASSRWIRVYDTATNMLKVSKENMRISSICGVIHPDGFHLLFKIDKRNIVCYKLSDLEMISNYQTRPTDDNFIVDLAIDKTGVRMLTTTYITPQLLDVSDPKTIKECYVIPKEGGVRFYSGIISDDGNFSCISAPGKIRIFKLEKGFEELCFYRVHSTFLRFLPSSVNSLHPPRLLFEEEVLGYINVYDPETQQVVKRYSDGYKTERAHIVAVEFLQNETLIMAVYTDGTLKIFDVESEENVYCFFNHRAQAYTSLAVHNSEKMFLAANENSMFYILKTERET